MTIAQLKRSRKKMMNDPRYRRRRVSEEVSKKRMQEQLERERAARKKMRK